MVNLNACGIERIALCIARSLREQSPLVSVLANEISRRDLVSIFVNFCVDEGISIDDEWLQE